MILDTTPICLTPPLSTEGRNPYAEYGPLPRQADGLITCPFCGMCNFDAPGLKAHLESRDCQPFEDTERLRARI